MTKFEVQLWIQTVALGSKMKSLDAAHISYELLEASWMIGTCHFGQKLSFRGKISC